MFLYWGVFAGALCLYTITQPTLLSWESYLYPLAVDGVIHLGKDVFSLHRPELDWTHIATWHPSHPGLHWLAVAIKKFMKMLGIQPASILVFIWFNRISGAVIAVCAAIVAKKVSGNNWLALLSAATMATVSGYWYWSMSGEVHLPSVALMCVIFVLFVARTVSTTANVITISILFSLAVIFHIRAAPFGLTVLYGLWATGITRKQRIHRICIFILISGLLVGISYIAPIFVAYPNTTVDELFKRIVTYRAYSDTLQLDRLNIAANNFFMMCKTLWYSVFFGFRDSVFQGLLATIFVSSVVAFAIRNKGKNNSNNKNPNILWAALLWFCTYFVFDWLLVPSAFVSTYKVFYVFPMMLMLGLALDFADGNKRFIAPLLVLIAVAGWNWNREMIYKTHLPVKRAYLSSNLEIDSAIKNISVVVNQNWLIPETWYLHHQYQDKNIYFLSTTEANSLPRLPAAVSTSTSSQLLVMAPGFYNPDPLIQEQFSGDHQIWARKPVETKLANWENRYAQFRRGPAIEAIHKRHLLVYEITGVTDAVLY